MKADDIGQYAPAAKFPKMGTVVGGTVTSVGDWQTRKNNFNKEQTSFRIELETDDGPLAIYPNKGSSMAQAIAAAVRESGASELTEGNFLSVEFSGEKNTGKGNPMKLFKATYAPGGSIPAPDEVEQETSKDLTL